MTLEGQLTETNPRSGRANEGSMKGNASGRARHSQHAARCSKARLSNDQSSRAQADGPVGAIRARSAGVSSSGARRNGEHRVGRPRREPEAPAARASRTSLAEGLTAPSLTVYSVLERSAPEPIRRHPPCRAPGTAWLARAWPEATALQADLLERARDPWCIMVVFIVRPPSSTLTLRELSGYIE